MAREELPHLEANKASVLVPIKMPKLIEMFDILILFLFFLKKKIGSQMICDIFFKIIDHMKL